MESVKNATGNLEPRPFPSKFIYFSVERCKNLPLRPMKVICNRSPHHHYRFFHECVLGKTSVVTLPGAVAVLVNTESL